VYGLGAKEKPYEAVTFVLIKALESETAGPDMTNSLYLSVSFVQTPLIILFLHVFKERQIPI